MPSLLSTVLLDPPTALLFGCAVALISARLIVRDPEAETRRTALLGGGWGVFYALCVGWFFFRHPDWMMAYLKDARDFALVPAYLVFVAICGAFGATGALANATLVQRGHRALAWALTAAAIVTLAGTFWLQWRQYFLLGTYEEFHAGRAAPLQSDATMQLAMNISGAVSTLGAIAVFVLRYLQARKAILAGAAPPPGTSGV